MGLDCIADLLATKPTSSRSLHKLLLVPQTGHLPQFQNHNISTSSRQSHSSYPTANWLTDTFSTLPPLRSIVQITYGHVFTMANAMEPTTVCVSTVSVSNVDGRRQLTHHIAFDGLSSDFLAVTVKNLSFHPSHLRILNPYLGPSWHIGCTCLWTRFQITRNGLKCQTKREKQVPSCMTKPLAGSSCTVCWTLEPYGCTF